MAIVNLPAAFGTTAWAGEFFMGVQRNDLEERSDPTGIRSARVLGPPQWTYHLRSPKQMTAAQAAVWKALVLGLDGLNNHLAAWNLVETAPRGTMRGTMTAGALSAGATSATITAAGQGTNTLLAGDWLQIGSGLTGQLVMVTADAVASGGVITVSFKHPMRYAQSGGVAVTWDKALGHYKLMSQSPNWSYEAGTLAQGGFELDFLEQW